MNLIIPKDCNITPRALMELKLQVKQLLNENELNKNKEYKIYLYSNFLRIKYLDKYYNVAIVEKNKELFWYVKPFFNNYLLVKKTHSKCFDVILLVIKNIT